MKSRRSVPSVRFSRRSATAKPSSTDYLALLNCIQKLGIRYYDISQVKYDSKTHIGNGASMRVHKGLLYNNPSDPEDHISVAVKIPKGRIMPNLKVHRMLNDIRQELRIMHHLANHPNII